MHILFKLIMLYLNPLIYLDKHIYELKMINFRLFYKLYSKKNLQNLSILISKDAFGADEFCSVIFKTVWYLSRPTGIHLNICAGQPFDCTTITNSAEECTLFLYSVMDGSFDIAEKIIFLLVYFFRKLRMKPNRKFYAKCNFLGKLSKINILILELNNWRFIPYIKKY